MRTITLTKEQIDRIVKHLAELIKGEGYESDGVVDKYVEYDYNDNDIAFDYSYEYDCFFEQLQCGSYDAPEIWDYDVRLYYFDITNTYDVDNDEEAEITNINEVSNQLMRMFAA